MTRDDVCTCAQYSQCPVCNKSRSNYAELMAENDELKAENKRLREALHVITKYPTKGGSAGFVAACEQLADIARIALEEVTP